MKEQAITAQDYETAARHRDEEERAPEAFVKALEAWRAELNPPEEARDARSLSCAAGGGKPL